MSAYKNEDLKRSPNSITLFKRKRTMEFSLDKVAIYSDYHVCDVIIELHVCAWQCPFCGNSEEYTMINDMIIHGIGGSMLASNGRISDCCDAPGCKAQQKEWHAEGPANEEQGGGE